MAIPPSALTLRPSSPRSAQEIDVELFAFIERYATNLARWDLLIYFGQHPSLNHDALAIAQQIGRAPRLVQKELDDLVYLGILRADRNNGSVHYGLARSASTRRKMMRLAHRSRRR